MELCHNDEINKTLPRKIGLRAHLFHSLVSSKVTILRARATWHLTASQDKAFAGKILIRNRLPKIYENVSIAYVIHL
jgi:hypothetical protein